MGGAMTKPTPKQMMLLLDLEAKKESGKITPKQLETLSELIAKRDSKPLLQEGAKTVCEKWLKEQSDLYNRRKSFSNKYTQKGIEQEQEGIRLTAEMMGYEIALKNEKVFYNDYIVGTPDLIFSNIIEDVKCSWDEQTFPLFAKELPNIGYWWQGQGYMDIVGRDRFAVNYCLVDAPTNLIDKAAKFKSMELGMSEVDADLYDEIAYSMTYTDVPNQLKFKRFEFTRDDVAIDAIHQQVILCRNYIDELISTTSELNYLLPSVIIASQPEPNVTLIEKA
jgi:hypothetical protein